MPTPTSVQMTRETPMPTVPLTPAASAASEQPADALQNTLNNAQQMPIIGNPNPQTNVTAAPEQDASMSQALAESQSRIRELETQNERMRGQVSQRSRAEQEAAARADQANSELVESQRQLAEAMQAMAKANTPDPHALTQDELAILGDENSAVISKMINAQVSPFVDQLKTLNERLAQAPQPQNITDQTQPLDEDRVRLITAKQTMRMHPDVLRAEQHPQWPAYVAQHSVDMPDATYEQLKTAYHDYGQTDAYVNIHTRFLMQVEPQPAQQQNGFAYPGLVPPSSGARPDAPPHPGNGNQLPLHLQPDFQEKLQRGEVTHEDFVKSRQATSRPDPMSQNGQTTWVR